GAIGRERAAVRGGIYAEGLAADAHLEIGANVLVFNNTARLSGGGIYLESMTMRMVEPGSSLAFNTAIGLNERGFGGGLMVLASDRDATAFVGSGGSIATPTIASNEARYGGGVSVVTNDDNDAILHLFGADPARRTSISGNTATVAGGGIYARSHSGFSIGLASSHLWNADILLNVAPDGAAAFMEEGEDLLGLSFGSRLNLNSTGFNVGPPEGLLPCPTGSHCGRIAGNETRDNGQPTAGAIIKLKEESRLAIHTREVGDGPPRPGGVVIAGNVGGRLVDSEGTATTYQEVDIRNTAIYNNTLSQQLIRAFDGVLGVTITDSTIAHNSIGAGHVLSVNGNFRLERSLIWQPGKTSLVHSNGSKSVQWTLASEALSLGEPNALQIAGPRFIDPANGDFRLRAASPAVDHAPELPGDDRDGHNLPRDRRLQGVQRPHEDLVRDVGAFERQTLQPLVQNRNFDSDLNLWSAIPGITATWDGSQNASGAAGSGSLFVNQADIPDSRVTVRTQCIHLPGPGRYLLNGWGRSGLGTPATRDAVLLHWALRHDGGEACDAGAPTASGDHLLTTANAWTRPVEPAEIVISAADWRHTSSISISLVVTDRGTTTPPTVTGWFDGITLLLTGIGPDIFSDGFE
ncbi:MAG TPA: hypothetical protein PKZ76_11915, partial [Xanthomonadaceae bacterium]|nr:hypothetical protein [Xanthomonadaceae bacterium]